MNVLRQKEFHGEFIRGKDEEDFGKLRTAMDYFTSQQIKVVVVVMKFVLEDRIKDSS